ncbi:serine/threonine-protein kinase 38-like isoform X1 [Ambystoma mexicanum]|uniref:serine/threonine-protein kinase 38-like isoform X1 n=1 Tax=Ambystoma mexicanum TaxID=8296 RepID=UPI0037E7F7CE
METLESIPIFNLSGIELTRSETAVLAKGLSFVPSNKTNWFNLDQELSTFFRTVRRKFYFRDKEPLVREEDSGLRVPSNFNPSENEVSPSIITFEKCIRNEMRKLQDKQDDKRRNLSVDEYKALKDLSTNKQIVIKTADKGGGIVIQNIDQYKNMVKCLLDVPANYKKLKKDPTVEIKSKIQEIVTFASEHGWISEKEEMFLTTSEGRIPAFYALPKIHKDQHQPPGRPIVSGCGSILEPICKFVDYFLKPLSQETPTYLRDTMATIALFENQPFQPMDELLVTMDIASLYTSIPQDSAVECIRQHLTHNMKQTRVPTNFIVELLELALRNNFFTFDEIFYLQISGTAMGAAFAPSLAVIFMSEYEQQLIFNTNNPFHEKISRWFRYIDDIIFIWRGDETALENFLEWINSQTSEIQFSLERSNRDINFLDLTISVKENKLLCSLFQKETDRNTLLHYRSFHPNNLRNNLPFGQFLRIRRNCTELQHYKENAISLQIKLRNRGYPNKLVKNTRKRAQYIPRETLLMPKIRNSEVEQQITCVSTFCPNTTHLKATIKKFWPLIQICLPDEPLPRMALKRGKNLKDILTHARLNKKPQRSELWSLREIVGHHPCGTCSVCKLTKKTTSFKIKQQDWKLKHFSNCKTPNVIYVIECPCGLRYVGQTKRQVNKRIGEHRSRIRCKTHTAPLVSHYLEFQHGVDDMKWWVVDIISNNTNITNALNHKEAWWIFKLKSITNGLNEATPTTFS